jgi:hypothetical protein
MNSNEINRACEHAYMLLREHVERYRTEIVVQPTAWRTRCKDLVENLDWLEFCRTHPLPWSAKTLPPKYPPPPPIVR